MENSKFIKIFKLEFDTRNVNEMQNFNELTRNLDQKFAMEGSRHSSGAINQSIAAFKEYSENVLEYFITSLEEAQRRYPQNVGDEEKKYLNEKGNDLLEVLKARMGKKIQQIAPGDWFDRIEKHFQGLQTKLKNSIELLDFPRESKQPTSYERKKVSNPIKVFISSTIEDLKPEREAAKEAVLNLRLEPVMSEDFGAQSESNEKIIKEVLPTCHIYVGIIGQRYGFKPDKGGGKSITELEFDKMRADGFPVLFFEKTSAEDREAELVSFLSRIKNFEEGFAIPKFDSPKDLADEIDFALRNLLSKVFLESLVNTERNE